MGSLSRERFNGVNSLPPNRLAPTVCLVKIKMIQSPIRPNSTSFSFCFGIFSTRSNYIAVNIVLNNRG